jgi:hypothetical protein
MGTPRDPLREALDLLHWRHPLRHTVAPWANEDEDHCVHIHDDRGPMCDLCRGSIDRWNREEAALGRRMTDRRKTDDQ